MLKLTECILVFLITVLLQSCASFELSSEWKDKDISIDGNASEWKGNMSSYDSTSYDSFVIGAYNDDENLYICLKTASRDLQAQLTGDKGQNLTIWIDPKGQKNKEYGLIFPGDMERNDKMRPERRGSKPGTNWQETDRFPDDRDNNTAGKNIKITAISPKPGSGENGIEAAIDMTNSGWDMVCEIKIPLKPGDDNRFYIPAAPGSVLGVFMEVQKIKNGMPFSHGGEPGKKRNGPPPAGSLAGQEKGMPGEKTGREGNGNIEKTGVFGRIILAKNQPERK